MEADQSFTHFCKLCNKKFRCGRSLGGHMRSHLTNTEPEFITNSSSKKLQVDNNGESNSNNVKSTVSSSYSGHGLRENPKRKSKHRNRDSDNSIPEMFCIECGKGFQSWKALFGHMKCHSEKERASIKMEDRESWSFENQRMIMDSQSDTEFSAPNRKKRSSRRRIRYSKTPPFSIASTSSSASEIDQEQEEIALSLIMLSRDRSQSGIMFSDRKSFVHSKPNSELGEMDSGNLEFLGKQTESKKIRSNKKSEFDDRVGMKTSDGKLGKKMIDEIENRSALENSEPKFRSRTRRISKIHNPDSEKDKNRHKRSKFECSSCRKIFRSYQALGGHKASHRMIKSCINSTMAVYENSIETKTENQNDPEISDFF